MYMYIYMCTYIYIYVYVPGRVLGRPGVAFAPNFRAALGRLLQNDYIGRVLGRSAGQRQCGRRAAPGVGFRPNIKAAPG